MLRAELIPYRLQFKKPALTSRGALQERDIYFLQLSNAQVKQAYGECGTLPGLSPDHRPDYAGILQDICRQLNQEPTLWQATFEELYERFDLQHFPSIAFGLETALLDLQHGGRRIIFENNFHTGALAIPINGLVWMNNKEAMLQEAREKIKAGFHCIKLKIGALDFDEECRMLELIRREYNAWQLEIRVDANGAFAPDTAAEQLRELSRFELHSIEQPIRAGQWDLMAELCSLSKIAIALDEELIGLQPEGNGRNMLRKIKAPYIILKPSLLGGFKLCSQWIKEAAALQSGYWITSALEANIGLNAIAQYSASLPLHMPQGLGTGQLYLNNIPSPLHIGQGTLSCNLGQPWDLAAINKV